MDYFVPNFGVDHDILDTWAHDKYARGYCKTGHCGQQWVVAAQTGSVSITDKDKKSDPINTSVPIEN